MQVGRHDLGRTRADAADRLQTLHVVIDLAQGVEAFLPLHDQDADLAIIDQSQVEQAAPQILRSAFGQGPSELSNALESQLAPGLGAARRRQTLANQDRADAVLHRGPPADQLLAKGN